MKLIFRINPTGLVGQNLGIDGPASAQRYLKAFERVVRERFPALELDCDVGAAMIHIQGEKPDGAILRETEAIAYGLRKAGHYLVYR